MSLPTSYKAAFLTSPDSPLKVSTRTLSSPSLSPDEVAIKLTATAINPVDWQLQGHPEYINLSLPYVLGTDAAGTIHAKGSAVKNFEVGDRVFFQGTLGDDRTASFQEYARNPAAVVGKTPSNISDEEAAGVSLAGVTAAVGIYHSSGRGFLPAPWEADGGREGGKGKAVVILGGSGSVGQYAVQLAKLSGFSKVVTNSGAGNIEMLKKLGATDVLDRKHATKAEDFLKIIGEEIELDFIYDTIGDPATQLLAVQILQGAERISEGGGMVVATHGADETAKVAGEKGPRKVEIKNIVAVGSSQPMRYVSEPFYKHLPAWLETGEFVPNKPLVIEGGVDAIEGALRKQQAGVSGAKVVVKF